MSNINQIKAAVAEELAIFESRLRSSLNTETLSLESVITYLLHSQGKRMRPLLVLLTAKLFGPVPERAYTAAVLIENFHSASLLHDDVIDDSANRRGHPTINVKWESKIAILTGDFLLSKMLTLSVDCEEYDLLHDAAAIVTAMSEGEILQITKSQTLDITEEEYYDVIYKKTASLIALCTKVGAIVGKASPREIEQLWQFGKSLGMAFQIKDDLLDFSKTFFPGKTGKKRGNDLKEQKITLPLIYALRQSSDKEREEVLDILKKGTDITEDEIESVSRFVDVQGGFTYAKQKMAELKADAESCLKPFADNPLSPILKQLLAYIIERDK